MPSPPPERSEPGAALAPARGSERARNLTWGALLLALSGFVIGVLPLLACGCALLGVALLARAWTALGVRGIEVRRRLVDGHVVEGELIVATIAVRGGRAWLFGARVSDALTGRELPVRGPGWIRLRRGLREQHVVTTAGRRGRHSFRPPRLVLDDPLGLACAYGAAGAAADELLVLPRTEPVVWVPRGPRPDAGDRHASSAIFGAGEIDGLRDYQLGTPATRVHWQSLARGSGLLERRLVAAAESLPTVVLDARGERTPAAQERLDAAVRATASLVLELARRGGCTVLLPGARTPVPVARNLRAWAAVHARLALVELDWSGAPPPQIRPEIVRGPLIYVSTGGSPPGSLRAGGALTVIAVRPLGGDGGGRCLFEVAGCGGYVSERGARRGARGRSDGRLNVTTGTRSATGTRPARGSGTST